jgi:hypothetical protein
MFVAITAVGLLVLIGLVVDGGAKVRAIEQADTVAAEAARAAGQAIALPGVMSGRQLAIDTPRARAAATAYLAAHDAAGTVTLDPGGRAITVTATITQPTVLLDLIGVREITAHGAATAILQRGITGALP